MNMAIKTSTRRLRKGWIVGVHSGGVIETPTCDDVEPLSFSEDPAFGDFNLPLEGSHVLKYGDPPLTEDESDLMDLRQALQDGEFVSYDDFRRDELGL